MNEEVYIKLLRKATSGVYFPETIEGKRRIELIIEENKFGIFYDGKAIIIKAKAPGGSYNVLENAIATLIFEGIVSRIKQTK